MQHTSPLVCSIPEGLRSDIGDLRARSAKVRRVPGGLVDFTDLDKEDDMDGLWLALYWTGPIGVAIFFMGLGVLFWGISKLRNK